MPDRRMFYDTIASEYDKVMSQYEIDKRLHLIFEDLLTDDLTDKYVLDMGCGTGWFTQKLIARGANVISSDISYGLLCETRKKHTEALLVQNSLEGLGLVSNYFDVVLCTEVIEHTPDPQHALSELMRVVKPGGYLILTVPNRVWRFSVTVADWLNIRPYAGLENWVTRGELRTWVSDAGCTLEKMIGFNLFPLFYRPFYGILNFADRRLKLLQPVMVNIGIRVRKPVA